MSRWSPERGHPTAWLTAAALLVALSGCGPLGTMAAPQDEYVAYRKVRTAKAVQQRLQASHDYLQAFPQGRWRQEVRPWFERAEARYWSRREESYQGLAEYLALLPRGPHAARAELELRQHRARNRELQSSNLLQEARSREQRLADKARARETARDAFGAWVGRMLAIESWGDRTSALGSEFLFAWRVDKPRARCVDDRCAKLVELPFELPGGEMGDRVMMFEVVLLLREAVVVEARLEGPGMFSRLYEAAKLKPVAHDDPAARDQAVQYAVEFIGGAAEARLPAERCRVESAAPVVLKRACDGWSLEVIAAAIPADDDVVKVSGPTLSR